MSSPHTQAQLLTSDRVHSDEINDDELKSQMIMKHTPPHNPQYF